MDNLHLALLLLGTFGFTDENLVGHLHHLVRAVLVEDDDIVYVGTVADILVLLQRCADEALLAVDVQFLVGLNHRSGGYGVEVLYLRQARMVLAVLLQDELEPFAGHLHHIGQFPIYLCQFLADAGHQFLGLVLVELQDAGHLYLHEAQDVVLGNLAHHLGIPWRQALVNPFAGLVHGLGILELLVLIDALLYEYLFQRGEVQLLQQLALADKPFLAQESEGVVHGTAQHIADGKELRFPLVDDTTVGAYAHLAIGTGIQGIYRLVGRCAGGKVHQYLHVGGCHVLHLAHLYLALLGSLQYGVDESGGFGCRACGLAEGNLRNGQRLVVALLYLGSHTHRTSALAVVVTAHVNAAARGEVGIQLELLAMEVFDGSLANLTYVVWQYLARQAHGNAFCSLCQKQGELHGQGHRLLVASVITQFPFRSLGIEDHIQGELGQAGLNVTGRGCIVAGEDIAPVSLAVNEQFLLSQLYQSVLDTGIAMGMELHGVTHNVGHLVVATVIHALHGVQYTTLDRLEAIADMRHGTLQNYIRSIVQKPVLVHVAEVVHCPTALLFVVCHFTGISVQIYKKDTASRLNCGFYCYLCPHEVPFCSAFDAPATDISSWAEVSCGNMEHRECL